ncbi:fibronectin type III domain-containing protein [bacterium]|nr:fibronectin type III domain-containing protein [bacterium]
MKLFYFVLLLFTVIPIFGQQYISLNTLTKEGKTFDIETDYLNLDDYKDNSQMSISFNVSLSAYDMVSLYFGTDSSEVIDESSTTNTFTFGMNGSQGFLTENSEGEKKVILKLTYTNELSNEVSERLELSINYDTKKPENPESITVTPGDKNLKVKWEHNEDSTSDDRAEYEIFYTDSVTNEEESKIVAGTNTSYTITGLINDRLYYVTLVAIDKAGNKADRSIEPVEGTPISVDDFYEYYTNHGGGEDGGFCFIATAAYGSYDNGMVKILRDFRDNYLKTTTLGSTIVNKYYQISPPLAKKIAHNTTGAFITRILLEPVVGYVAFVMYTPIWLKVLILALFVYAWIRYRKYRRGIV